MPRCPDFRLGVGAVLKPEREVAAGLLGYALRSSGEPEDRVAGIVASARASGWKLADLPSQEPELHVPELRPHRDRA